MQWQNRRRLDGFTTKGQVARAKGHIKCTNIVVFGVLYTVAGPICGHIQTYLIQDGRTPLMVATGAGHLQVAKLLLETHRSNVNEEDSKVSGWAVMGRMSEHSSCVTVPRCDQVMQGARTQRS